MDTQDNAMSMYFHLQTLEHRRHTEDAFQTFVVVHNEHLCAIIVEFVMQLVLLIAVMCGLVFLGATYLSAVMHFTHGFVGVDEEAQT